MATYNLDRSYARNSIKTAKYELQFRYNTNKDYFYFDVFTVGGETLSRHNKVITGYDFGGFHFVSNEKASYAMVANVESFRLVTDG